MESNMVPILTDPREVLADQFSYMRQQLRVEQISVGLLEDWEIIYLQELVEMVVWVEFDLTMTLLQGRPFPYLDILDQFHKSEE